MDADAPIGVFDSGLGGLTVLKEIHEALPGEGTVYLGDTARVPYGTRSTETIIKYSLECAGFLVSHGIKLLVVACNSASSVALESIRNEYPVPVIGVIGPGARAAVKGTTRGRVGVIGTEATIRSGAYQRAISELDGKVEIYTQACPLFVPLAEEGWVRDDVARLTAQRYLAELKEDEIDTLVLGCTHYPLLKDIIAGFMGPGVALVDSAIETARAVGEELNARGLVNTRADGPFRRFFVSDSHEKFKIMAERFLDGSIRDIEVTNFIWR